MKKCRVCKKSFEPYNSLQVACSPKCAVSLAKDKRQKKEKKELATFRNENKTIQKRIQEAQAAFNGYIRERDHNKPCVSCGATQSPQWDAGHYRSRGAASHLRFNLLNTHKQCNKCNRFLSGNVVEYRKGLADRISEEQLKGIEDNYKIRKFDKEYLERVKKIFNKRARLYVKLRQNK